MACPSTENLTRFIYDEGAAQEMQELHYHIEGCRICREEVRSLRALDNALPEIIRADSRSEMLGAECPDALTLAGYLSRSLPPEERAGVETHLVRCQSCVEELVAAGHGLASTPRQYLQTPAHLLNEAIRLGASSMSSPSISESPGVWAKICKWFAPAGAGPRWAFAGVGACAVVMLALFLTRQMYQREAGETPGDGPAINKITQPDEGITRPTEDVVAESRLDLSRDLKQALIDHDPKNTSEPQKQLLAIIEKRAPQMPVDKIKNVEIKQNLLIAIASVSDLAGQVRLRLYKDGLLVISADS